MAGRWWLWLVVAAGVAQAQVGLEPGVDLQGRVVDDQGQPQAGVYVRLEQADSGEESLARTDAEGRFTLTDLVRDGDYELTVVEDLGGVGEEDFYVYRGYVRLSRTVAAADLPLTGWEIVVPAVQRMTLRGRVVDDEGRPVAGATVRLKGGVAARDDIIEFDLTTAADGTYEAANLPTDVLLQANVHVPGYVPEQVRDLVPGERVFPDLQVAALTHEVTGRVVDAAGAPVAGARVLGGTRPVVETTTDESGAFRLAGLPRGPVTLRAGDEQRAVATVIAPADGPSVTITLQPLPLVDPERGREVAVELLHTVWANAELPVGSRAAALEALGSLDPVAALQAVGFQPARERGPWLVALWPVVAFEAPLVALQAVDGVEALGGDRAARARLLLAVGLLEAGHRAQAEALAAATPVPAAAPVVTRALAALVGMRLGQPGAAERWAAAAPGLRPEDGAAMPRRTPGLALASLIGADEALLATMPHANGLPEYWEICRLTGLLGTQPAVAAEQAAAPAGYLGAAPARGASRTTLAVALALLRALPAAERGPWADRLPAPLAGVARAAADALNGDPASTTVPADPYEPTASQPSLPPARAWLLAHEQLARFGSHQTGHAFGTRLATLLNLAEVDPAGALPLLTEGALAEISASEVERLVEVFTTSPAERAWQPWVRLLPSLSFMRGAVLVGE